MDDLHEFKNRRIESLQKEVAELREIKLQYATWIMELCDEETPDEYREIILTEIQKNY